MPGLPLWCFAPGRRQAWRVTASLVTYFPRVDNKAAARKYRAGRGFSSYASWNLEMAPFGLPPPLLSIGWDGSRADRVVGLWPCANLRPSLTNTV